MIAVSFPVILSFAVGLWYMKKTGDVQTAWTLASYIVTGVGGERSKHWKAFWFGLTIKVVLVALFGVAAAIREN